VTQFANFHYNTLPLGDHSWNRIPSRRINRSSILVIPAKNAFP